MSTLSEADEYLLRQINDDIVQFENEGNKEALSSLLEVLPGDASSHVLAFRRASGACVDATRFLDAVAGGGRRMPGPVSIETEGTCAALVRCVVTIGDKSYRNLRVFVRATPESNAWRLLAWVNEEIVDH